MKEIIFKKLFKLLVSLHDMVDYFGTERDEHNNISVAVIILFGLELYMCVIGVRTMKISSIILCNTLIGAVFCNILGDTEKKSSLMNFINLFLKEDTTDACVLYLHSDIKKCLILIFLVGFAASLLLDSLTTLVKMVLSLYISYEFYTFGILESIGNFIYPAKPEITTTILLLCLLFVMFIFLGYIVQLVYAVIFSFIGAFLVATCFGLLFKFNLGFSELENANVSFIDMWSESFGPIVVLVNFLLGLTTQLVIK